MDICRICMVDALNTDFMISIFNNVNGHLIADMVVACSGYKIPKVDNLPKIVCQTCCDKLEIFYNLRRECRQSYRKLKEMIRDQKCIKKQLEDNEFDSTVEYLEETIAEDVPHIKMEFDEETEVNSNVDYFKDEEDVNKSRRTSTRKIKLSFKVVAAAGASKEASGPVKHKKARHESGETSTIKCCGCAYTCFDFDALEKHSKVVHEINRFLNNSRSKIECEVCFARFNNQVSLDKHKNHERVKFKCQICDCVYFSEETLRSHENKYHDDLLYKCCSCDYTGDSEEALKQHSANEHEPYKKTDSNNMYECEVCFKRFPTIKSRKIHKLFAYRILKGRRKKNILHNRVRCCGCSEVFVTVKLLQQHMDIVHRPNKLEDTDVGAKPFECQNCFRRFKTQKVLERHAACTVYKKKLNCSYCTVVKKTEAELIKHELTHTGFDAFKCCGCKSTFKTKDLLMTHSQSKHAHKKKVYEGSERPYECEVCFRSYRCFKDLRAHQRFVYVDRPNICDVCGKKFRTPSSLMTHGVSHIQEKNHECAHCGKKFKHISLLNKHLLVHTTTEKNLICNICDARFPRQEHLRSHLVSHSTERKFECKLCSQTYKRHNHLVQHVRRYHTGEKKYPCRYCECSYFGPYERKKHEMKHLGNFPYSCKYCDKKFPIRHRYIVHMETHVAESKKIHQCSMCPKKFSDESFLDIHFKFNHSSMETKVENEPNNPDHLQEEIQYEDIGDPVVTYTVIDGEVIPESDFKIDVE